MKKKEKEKHKKEKKWSGLILQSFFGQRWVGALRKDSIQSCLSHPIIISAINQLKLRVNLK